MTTPWITRARVRLAIGWLVVMLALMAAQALWWASERRERAAEAALAQAADARGAVSNAVSNAASSGASRRTAPVASAASGATTVEGDEEAPRRRFARGLALAAAGDDEGALARWRGLHADTPLGQAARFNSANALMRQAAPLLGGPRAGEALPMLELAKALYRDVLRHEPAHWPARYNLERAQRLLPEPEPSTAEEGAAPQQRERAPTTARGVAQGMP